MKKQSTPKTSEELIQEYEQYKSLMTDYERMIIEREIEMTKAKEESSRKYEIAVLVTIDGKDMWDVIPCTKVYFDNNYLFVQNKNILVAVFHPGKWKCYKLKVLEDA